SQGKEAGRQGAVGSADRRPAARKAQPRGTEETQTGMDGAPRCRIAYSDPVERGQETGSRATETVQRRRARQGVEGVQGHHRQERIAMASATDIDTLLCKYLLYLVLLWTPPLLGSSSA